MAINIEVPTIQYTPKNLLGLVSDWQGLRNKQAESVQNEALAVRQSLLFDQQQEEYNQKVGERKAKDLLAAGLREGPKTDYLDMNPWAEQNGQRLEGMEILNAQDVAGNQIQTDRTGRVLSAPEVEARRKKQEELGALVDTPEFRRTESRPELLSRIIAGVEEKGLPIRDLVAALEEARGAELTTQEKEKEKAAAELAANKKALLDLQDKKTQTFLEYGIEKPRTVLSGSVVTGEDEEFGTKNSNRAAQAAYKEKKDALKGLTGNDAINAKQGLEDEVVGWGTRLAGLFGASDKAKIREYMDLTKDIAAPEVAANYARLYGKDEGFFEDSLKDPAKIRDGLLQYVASLDTEKNDTYGKASGRGTSLKSTENQFTQVGTKLTPEAIVSLYEGREGLLKDSIKKAEEALLKAGMTSEQKNAAKYGKADKEVRALLDWRYAQPSESIGTASTAPTVAGDAAQKSTASAILPAPVRGTPQTKEIPIEKPAASAVVSGKTADSKTAKKMTFGQVNDALEELWDKDPNSSIINTAARTISDAFTMDQMLTGASRVPLVGKTKMKATRVLQEAGVFDKTVGTKENAERLGRYLQKANISDNARPLLNQLYYDMKMQSDAKYRNARATEERQQALAGTINAALSVAGPIKESFATVAAAPLLAKAAAAKQSAAKAAEWLDDIAKRPRFETPSIMRSKPRSSIIKKPATKPASTTKG